MLPVAGDLISGKYRIVRLIGDGGMGTVYEARHEGLRTQVALKFLHEDLAGRAGLAERFLQEARVAATIKSPHVAQVTDVDVGPKGQPYLVMELLSGESLRQRLDAEKKLPPPVAVDFALQIAAGLEAAHAIGVVHRDLKPDNVFVTPGAGGPLLKLIDFGIAKLFENQRGLTRAGVVMGTAEYMPPEQLYAASDVDGRADVYALGVILFEALSGRRPADGEDAQVIVGKVLAGDVLSLATLEPELPAGLIELVQRSLASDRNARVGSAHELRVALAAFAGELSPAGLLASRKAAVAPPAAATPKTLAEQAREAFAKGSTEQAAPLAGAVSITSPAAPPLLHGAPHLGGKRRRSRAPGLILVLLVALGAAAGGYLLLNARREPLPPPPVDTPIVPVEPALSAESDETSLIPTATVAPPATTPAPRPIGPPAPTPSPPPHSAPVDAGTFPLPLLPSSFPPVTIPSGIPTTFPNVLPSSLPTVFPTFPGLPGAPAPTTVPGSSPGSVPGSTPGAVPGTRPGTVPGTAKDGGKSR